MELLVAAAFLMLLVMLLAYASKTNSVVAEVEQVKATLLAYTGKTNEVAEEIERLKRSLGDQGAELNRLLEIGERQQSAAVRAPASPAHHAAARAADQVAAAPPPVEPAAAVGLLEPGRDVLVEAIPEIGIASALADVARPQRRGPSPVERWMQSLRTTEEWEALIGGRLLNRIGAIALILGVAFFFKYAVDQNWIGQGARVGIGLLAGAGLLGLAARAHNRGYAIFGQGLVGTGLAVLYLSVYASFNFYHLVPQPVALAGMGVITALAFVQAVYYDSLAVSLLACAGGYLTPLLLRSSESGPVGTIAYVFLLDLGTLAVLARRRAWVVLEPIALGATYAIFLTWYVTSYSADRMVTATVAVSLFWALFLAFDVYSLLVEDAAWPGLRHTLGAINGLAYYAALFLLVGQHRGWMALLTVLVGGVYVAALLAVRRRGRLDTGTAARYTLAAIVLLVAATAIRFTGFTVVVLWSLEALPLVWYGTRWRLWYVWRPALWIYALAVGLLFATPGALAYTPIASFRPLINERALAYLVLAAALAACTVPFRRLGRDRSQAIETSLQYVWAALIFVLLAVETVDLFRHLMINVSAETRAGLQFDRSLAVAAIWVAYSLPLVWAGLRRRILPWVVAGLGSAAAGVGLCMLAGLTYEPIGRFVPLLNDRVAVFLLIIGALALHLRRLGESRGAYPWVEGVRTALQVTLIVLPFELASVEINDYFQHRFGHPLPAMDAGGAFVELAWLAAIWMLYSLLPVWYGVRRRTMPLVTTGLSMAAAATGVAAFGGIVYQPRHEFALMLGVRPIILTIVAAGLLIQLRWLRNAGMAYHWVGGVVVAIQVAIILFGFGLISAETRDAFAQRIAGNGSDAATWRDLERLAFSLVWLAYAVLVMSLGIWRRARWMRLGAMALFAFIILKVFVYDLSFLGAVYRPVSFVGLGVILLAVSYLYGRYRSVLLADVKE